MTFLAPETLLGLSLLIPFAAALLIPVFHASPNLREGVTLGAAGLLFIVVLSLLPAALAGQQPEALRFTIVEGIAFGLKLEPLGMLFMLVASGLWIVNSL